jgi:micrococcal nuclease
MGRGTRNKTFRFLFASFVFLFLADCFFPDIFCFSNDKQAGENENLTEGLLTEMVFSSSSAAKTNKIKKEQEPVSENSYKKSEEVKPHEKIILYKVVKVVDGDTIDIDLDGKTVRLRLIGINTPEIADSRKPVECFGEEAENNARRLLTGRKVKIAADPSQNDKDKYGRLLRYVWRDDGVFYNLEALRDGFAREYTFIKPYEYQAEFKAAEKAAKKDKAGLWADNVCAIKNEKASSSDRLE